MEGSRSEAVFDSYGLNPQLFINEVLNIVDDLVDEAFDFCQRQAPAIVGVDAGTDRADELRRGITSLHHSVRATLNKRMSLWERYCLLHCFSTPEGFSSDKTSSSADPLLPQDGFHDDELDSQLDSLRKKLAMVGNESAALQRDIGLLERHSAVHSGYHESVAEALRILEEDSVHKVLQEIDESTFRLYEEMKILRTKAICSGTSNDAGEFNGNRWIGSLCSSTKLEDIQTAADVLNLFRKP